MSKIGQAISAGLQHRGMTQGELAKAAKISPGSVSNYISGLRDQPRSLVAIASALRCDPARLQDGEYFPVENQVLSLSDATMAPPEVKWEVVKLDSAGLPASFMLTMRDDSMAPDAKRGARAMFTKGAPFLPGDGILVLDSAGEAHLRVYERKAAGEWWAVPLNKNYPTLKSTEEPLTVVAVLEGVLQRWSDRA